MIVVRANHHVFRVLCIHPGRQDSNNVLVGAGHFFDGGSHSDFNAWKSKAHGCVRIFPIEGILNLFQISLAGGGKQCVGKLMIAGHSDHAGAGCAPNVTQWDELAGILGVWPSYDNDTLGLVRARHGRLAYQGSAAHESLTTFGINLFGHISQGQHHLTGRVDIGVGIISNTGFARDRQAVSCKDHF